MNVGAYVILYANLWTPTVADAIAKATGTTLEGGFKYPNGAQIRTDVCLHFDAETRAKNESLRDLDWQDWRKFKQSVHFYPTKGTTEKHFVDFLKTLHKSGHLIVEITGFQWDYPLPSICQIQQHAKVTFYEQANQYMFSLLSTRFGLPSELTQKILDLNAPIPHKCPRYSFRDFLRTFQNDDVQNLNRKLYTFARHSQTDVNFPCSVWQQAYIDYIDETHLFAAHIIKREMSVAWTLYVQKTLELGYTFESFPECFFTTYEKNFQPI